MIFITVGTHHLAFDRLLNTVKKLVESKVITEKIVVQAGTSNIKVTGSKQKDYFSFEELL